MDDTLILKKKNEIKLANRIYMKKYVENATDNVCEICGGRFKSYKLYQHKQGKMHLKILEIKSIK